MKYKVFFDTSTLIASSILLSTESIGVEIKDLFYDEATRLVSIIKKNINKRIGITTYAAEDEAYSVMGKAIERKLSRKISDRSKVFRLLSIATNLCESRLKNVLSFIVRDPINPTETARIYIIVAMMYNGLEQKALKLPRLAYLQAGATPSFLNKAEMFDMYRSQNQILNAQLTNLIYNPVEDSDKMILAQATHLCNLYKGTEGKISFYLASTDHHFVPVRKRGLESKQVTDAIECNLGVIADKPHQIFLKLKEEYGY